MVNPPPAFRAELAALDPDRFAAFVADLWAARGRTVRREDALIEATDPSTGETISLYAHAADDAESGPEDADDQSAGEPIPEDVDVVVRAGDAVPAAPTEARQVGTAGIYELVRYAIGRDDTERLLTEYLAPSLVPDPPQPPAVDASDDSPEPRPGATHVQTRRSDPEAEAEADAPAAATVADPQVEGGPSRWRRRTVLLGAGVFLAGLGTAAASGVGPFDDSAGEQTEEPPGTPSEAPETVPVAGLTADGVGSPRTLAVGHVDRLGETAFTIDSRKTIHDAKGRLLSSVVVEARLTADRQFRVSAAAEGPAGRPIFQELPASAELWSDGETYVRRITLDGETSYEEYPPGVNINDWYLWSNIIPFGGPPYNAYEFYRDFFEAVPLAVEAAGDSPYELTTYDAVVDPAPLFFDSLDLGTPVDDLDVLALVTGPGLIRSTRLDYGGDIDDRPVDVGWSIEYSDVGATTVERPDWVDRALGE